MVVSVALTLYDELVTVPRQKLDGMQGLYVFLARLAIQFDHTFPCRSVVRYQATVVLVAIQLEHIDGLAVRTPGNVGEVDGACVSDRIADHTAVGGLERDGFVCVDVINTHLNHMGVHTRHGIFVWLVGGFAGEDVHLRVVGNHRLVHTVKGQPLTVRTPEGALVDAELIAVYGLAVHNVAAAVRCQLVLVALAVNDKQLVIFHIHRSLRDTVPVVGFLSGDAILPNNRVGHIVQ